MYQALKYRGETPRTPLLSMPNCLQKSQTLEAYISKLASGIFKVRASKVQKNVIFDNLKKNFETEKKNLTEMIEYYKTSTEGKIALYEGLINQKRVEVLCLKNEKENLAHLFTHICTW